MSKTNVEKLENEAKFLIEHYTGCEYKTLLDYSGYIKRLLMSTKDNCLKNVNANSLIGKDFSEIYRNVTCKKIEEATCLTEKCIKRKQVIDGMINELENKNVEFLEKINLYFEMLFVYETLWSLEIMKNNGIILDKEQKEIFEYLSGVAKTYINLTDKVIKKSDDKVKTLVK